VIGVAAISCIWFFAADHDDGSYRVRGFTLARATIYANYSDRSARSHLMSRLPVRGWAFKAAPLAGSPRIEITPRFQHASAPIPGWAVQLPLWIPLLVTGLPAGWLWWRHLRMAPYQCAACGYDLRGAVGEVCPECGTKREGSGARLA
jgi:hypothetical protein